jgi:hypothetical protein
MICGFATFHNEPALVVGHQKGHDFAGWRRSH